MSAQTIHQKQTLSLYAQINVAKAQLGLDEETYRAMLAAQTGKISLKTMDKTELLNVRDHLVSVGFKVKPAPRHGAKPSVAKPKQAQIDKVEALLADAGRPWEYLTSPHRTVEETTGKADARSMLERITGKQKMEFCTHADLAKVIAALQIDQQRRQRREEATASDDEG